MAAQNRTFLPDIRMHADSPQDTVVRIEFDETSLDKINDIRKQFEKQNKMYYAPVRPNAALLRFIQKDELKISNEALYWARMVRDASAAFDSWTSFSDTIIFDPIFLTPLFRGDVLPENLTLYDKDKYKAKSPYDFIYKPDSTLFANYYRRKKADRETALYLESTYPQYFRHSLSDLPKEKLVIRHIKTNLSEDIPVLVQNVVTFDDVDAPAKFIPDRRYWTSSFEGALQFSQNHVSENWPTGGSSNLNIFGKMYMKYDYNRGNVQITNEAELTSNTYTAPKDTLRNYRVGNDILRLHSNVGYKAFNKWFYTYDFEFMTQIFTNYQENLNTINSAFLAPLTINMGIGMKYDLEKQYAQKYKKLKLTVNVAPIAYTYKYSIKNGPNMDLGRNGFDLKNNPVEGENQYRNVLHIFGPSIRVDMLMNFTRNISWLSRLYMKTDFDDTQIEFENTLTLAISRYFSTRIYLYPRYDDKKDPNVPDKNKIQLNELLSFGFNYKW